MTVMTVGQMIWRALVGEGCELMGVILLRAAISMKRPAAIKRKRPKKAPSRDIDFGSSGSCRDAETGICDVGNPASAARRATAGKPAVEGVADAVRDAAIRRDRAGTFPSRLRAGLRRPRRRDRRDRARSRNAGLRQHHHGAGALGQAAHQGVGGVLRPGLGGFQSGAAGDRQGGVVADGAALEPDHDERGAVRPDRACCTKIAPRSG